ncbi:MAG: (Fe-S)-binding protein [Thermoanaerobaculia bacterium]
MPQPHSGRSLIDDCVHCGFCLPQCPTYISWGEEMDSPRGRIVLMKGLAEGTLDYSDTVVGHFDRCLGCMACVTACPSGVKYDVLIEETRANIEEHHRRGVADRLHRRMVFTLFPYAGRLKALLALLFLYGGSGLQWIVRKSGVLNLLPRRLAQLDALMPSVSLHHLTASLPAVTPAKGMKRARVGLLAGCVQRVFFPGVNESTVRVLSAEGCEVVVPQGQGCCGALSMHAGRDDEAMRFARSLIAAFEKENLDTIIVNAAGCGSHMKDLKRILANDPEWASRAETFSMKVRDISEFLAALPAVATRHPLHARVAYHDACHLAHAQKIRAAPRQLLRGIPGLELVEIPDSEQCCGSAGIYNLIQPESAGEIGARKVANVLSTKAELLASANPGCTLQIQKILRESGLKLRSAHPIEILDASIRGDA